MGKTLVIGATGLVGSRVAAAGRRVSLLVRKPLPDAPVSADVHVADSGDWAGVIAQIAPDTVVCCIGTTAKAAGSAEAFRAVDQHLVLDCARAALGAGCRHMIIVSSVGANADAAGLYLRTKGVVEQELRALGFARLDILRPGLLIGARTESRPAEAVGQMLAPLFNPFLFGGLRKYRSIDADVVARAIGALIAETAPGTFIHENDAMQHLAN